MYTHTHTQIDTVYRHTPLSLHMYLKFRRSCLTHPHTHTQYRIQGSLIKWLGPVSGQWRAWPAPPCQHLPVHPPPLFIPSNTRQRTRKWGHAACTPIHLNSMTTTANKSFIHCLIYCLPGQKSCRWYEDRFTPCRWGSLERDFFFTVTGFLIN